MGLKRFLFIPLQQGRFFSSLLLKRLIGITDRQEITKNDNNNQHKNGRPNFYWRRPAPHILKIQAVEFIHQLAQIQIFQLRGFHCFSPSLLLFREACLTVNVKLLA